MPKVLFLLSLVLLRFLPKKAKCVVLARKSRQQIGLKAFCSVTSGLGNRTRKEWCQGAGVYSLLPGRRAPGILSSKPGAAITTLTCK